MQENLTNYLINNPDEIIKILELVDFHNISFRPSNNEIRCAYYEGGNPTSVVVKCDNLYTHVYSKNISGNLYYVISIHKDWSYSNTIKFIKSVLNFDDGQNIASYEFFGGVYRKFYRHEKSQTQISEIESLDDFDKISNLRFLKDGISLKTQEKFEICYDFTANRIIVPWYSERGQLVGITGRYNFDDLGNHPKWKTLKNFQKSNFLYGLWQNKDEIYDIYKKRNYVLVGESEKFVMQLDSFGYHNGLALGGCNISEEQAQLLKSLPVDKIIICLDEGISAEHILNECSKLQGGIFNNKKIWCIFDKDNKIMKKGSKVAPTDLGKENFEYLLQNCSFEKEEKDEY